MKKLILSIEIAFAAVYTQAQTTPAWTLFNGFLKDNPDIVNTTNIGVVIAPLYAPHVRDDNGTLAHWGASLGAFYPANENVLVGLRGDYLGGNIFVGTANATLQLPVKIANSFSVNPFIIGGTGVPMTGVGKNNGNIIGIVGGGVELPIAHGQTWSLGLLAEYEKWSSFSGNIYHFGANFSKSF